MAEREQRIGKNETPLRYPKDLVTRFGAKAGLLMYVARELPNIPQAKMVVSTTGEPAQRLLTRANEAGIGWPRLFRSSAVAELVGYEGDFLTEEVKGYEEGHAPIAWNELNSSMYGSPAFFQVGIENIVERVKKSARRFKIKDPSLPDEINVIVAEKSPSTFTGTYIRLPNGEKTSLISITDMLSPEDSRSREDYTYSPTTGLQPVTELSGEFSNRQGSEMEQDLEIVAQWHDQISQLPEMDPDWSYQIEFGIDPPCLYQIRPFKPIQKADFKIENPYLDRGSRPFVMGITPQEGLLLYVVNNTNGNPRDLSALDTNGNGILFVGNLKKAEESELLPNIEVILLSWPKGLLTHGGIKQMRKAQVAVLNPWRNFHLEDGSLVRLFSNGTDIQIAAA